MGKLDKLLLELYDSVVEGPRGDVFRVIGGGATVGRQNLYVKQQQKLAAKSQHGGKRPAVDVEVSLSGGANAELASSPTSLVKRALERNLPKGVGNLPTREQNKEREAPRMSLLAKTTRSDSSWRVRLVGHGSFTQLQH